MAAKEKVEVEAEGGEKKSGKGLMIALIAVVVLLLVAVGGLAFMLMSSSGHKEDDYDAQGGGHQQAQAYKPEDRSKQFAPTYKQFQQPLPGAAPQYIDMDQFVTNFKGEGKAKHLAVKIKLMTYFPELSTSVGELKPILNDRILSLLRKKSYTELNTDDAQEVLASELLTIIRAVLDEQKIYPDTLEKVLVERFVMQ